jgi:hypothetical protein
MDKGNGLFSGIRTRRNSKVSINLDDEQQWEGDMVCKAECLNDTPQDGKIQAC